MKNKKDARFPLRPEVVEALRSMGTVDVSPFHFIFNGQVPRVKALRKDLSRAGFVFIDGSERRMDFHALRMTFGTLLAVNHEDLTDAVHLLRHSDPKLTMKVYTDASQLSLNEPQRRSEPTTLINEVLDFLTEAYGRNKSSEYSPDYQI
jgi:integrase